MTTIEPPTSPETIEATVGPYDPELKEAGQLTSPTWELELFLSGAFVFSMFQLPGLIEQLFSHIEPHATENMSYVLFTGAIYAKAIAFTLVGMFLIHLVTRAYWVALMGVHSVFSRGIRWEETKLGPLSKELYRSSAGDMRQSIAKLDNFCSIVFSVGLLIVLFFVYSTLLVGTVGLVSYLLARTLTHGQGVRFYFYAVIGLFALFPMVARIMDLRGGDRMVPGSRPHRFVIGVLKAAQSINVLRVTGPMVWTLTTNVGRKKSSIFLMVVLTTLITLSAADRLAQSDRLSVNGYDFFGASRAHGVNYRYYENQREEGKPFPRIPSIQSDIIRDPYVKLFIPYYPRRDNAAVSSQCPGVKPLQDRGLQIGADAPLPDSLVMPVLDCLARLRAVTLDGTRRPDLQFSFYESPTTGLKGILSYISADSLARGRHTITVRPLPAEDQPFDTVALAKAAHVIPFWR